MSFISYTFRNYTAYIKLLKVYMELFYHMSPLHESEDHTICLKCIKIFKIRKTTYIFLDKYLADL